MNEWGIFWGVEWIFIMLLKCICCYADCLPWITLRSLAQCWILIEWLMMLINHTIFSLLLLLLNSGGELLPPQAYELEHNVDISREHLSNYNRLCFESAWKFTTCKARLWSARKPLVLRRSLFNVVVKSLQAAQTDAFTCMNASLAPISIKLNLENAQLSLSLAALCGIYY
jgi:hypothetical protein